LGIIDWGLAASTAFNLSPHDCFPYYSCFYYSCFFCTRQFYAWAVAAWEGENWECNFTFRMISTAGQSGLDSPETPKEGSLRIAGEGWFAGCPAKSASFFFTERLLHYRLDS
jgi:hypothetical protein